MRKLVASVLLLSVLLVSTHAGKDSLLAQGSSSPRPSDEKVFLVFLRRTIEAHVRAKSIRVDVYFLFLSDKSQQSKKLGFRRLLQQVQSVVNDLNAISVEVVQERRLTHDHKSKLTLLLGIALADAKELIKEIKLFLKGEKHHKHSNDSKFQNSFEDSFLKFESLEIKLNLFQLEASNLIINLLEIAIYEGKHQDLHRMALNTIKMLQKIIKEVQVVKTEIKESKDLTKEQKQLLLFVAVGINQQIRRDMKRINERFLQGLQTKGTDKSHLQSAHAV